MAKSDLLKEAIADARAVKETAIANAKIALQEAWSSKLTGMFEQEIEDELGDEEEVVAPEMDANLDAEAVPGEEEDVDGVSWVDNDISFSVGGDTYDYEISEPVEDEEAPIDDMGNTEAPADDEFAAEDEEDLNLEAIIRELEGDLAEGEMDMKMDMEAEEEMPTEGYDHEDDMMSEDIDKIIEAILREEEFETEGDVPSTDEDGVAKTDAELAEAKAELEEAYSTVRQLKSIINEVNLLNAKLLYTNKLFRNFELNENQKMKVIENFDRAGTTREVKLVFTTLAESFNRPTKKRVVKESYASRPSATTAPKKETTQVLSEGFELANRWKKLAGLL